MRSLAWSLGATVLFGAILLLTLKSRRRALAALQKWVPPRLPPVFGLDLRPFFFGAERLVIGP